MSIICIGDFGMGNDNQIRVSKLLKKLISNYSTKLVLGLGDNIYPDGIQSVDDKKLISQFEEPYRNLPKGIKFYNVLGNHDYHGKVKPQIDYTNISDRWILYNNWYHFEKKINNQLIHFYAIDTNFDKLSDKMKKKQESEILDALEKSKAKWNIVYGHHPFKSTGYHGNSSSDLELFYKKLIATNKVDIILSGHDHDQQHLYIPDLPHLIVSGTGSDTRKVASIFRSTFDLLFYSEELGCGVLIFDKDKINIKFFNVDGEELYSYTINKD
tara:strand:+ start:15795 stop:16604 length:810 start_codon:yes stop_codon:yes gene_type:complete